MDFRYQEVLTWIIPGFYFLSYMSFVYWLVFPESELVTALTAIVSGGDASMALLLFGIPIFSLIIGWVFNGVAGYLFRIIMNSPITNAYIYVRNKNKEKNNDNASSNNRNNNNTADSEDNVKWENVKKAFDDAREDIDLDKVDRFYYRYVYSRNMFVTQLYLTGLPVLLFFFMKCRNWPLLLIACYGLFWVFIFKFMVERDLYTHAKYVLLMGKEKGIILTNNQADQNGQTGV